MKMNAYRISRWDRDKKFQAEVDAAVRDLVRGYPGRHHGQRPAAHVISAWRYDCALALVPKYEEAERKAAAEKAAAEKAAAEAEALRIRNLPENKKFWELRKKERELWRPLWLAYQRGEKASRDALDALVVCAEALLEAAKAREAAGLETSTWYADEHGFFSSFCEGYELHYAREHALSAKELRDIMLA